jgi:hypothetical protein
VSGAFKGAPVLLEFFFTKTGFAHICPVSNKNKNERRTLAAGMSLEIPPCINYRCNELPAFKLVSATDFFKILATVNLYPLYFHQRSDIIQVM